MSLLDAIRYAAIAISVVVIIAGLTLLFMSPEQLESIFGEKEAQIIDFETLQRSNKKNSYLLCAKEHCPLAEPDGPAPVFGIAPERLRAILLDYVDNSPNIELRHMDLALQQFDFVERTPAMRFPDMITVRLYPAENGGSTMAIYSRSIYGHSDFDTNQKRVSRWITILTPAESF